MSAVFYIGDAIETMNKLPAGSVDLILTSPPFLALRSYLPADHELKSKEGGSQSTPGEFIDWLIDFAEASARVLAPHGSFCVELGDTFSGSGGAGGDYAENGLREGQPKFRQVKDGWPMAKSLALIPEMFRFSLVYGFNPLTGRTTDRWRLRNVVRWVRPNPPVGALGDKFRPATSELMVFCKSAKRYFDLDAVREPNQTKTMPIVLRGEFRKQDTGSRHDDGALHGLNNPAGTPPLDWWEIPPGGFEGSHYAVFPPALCVKPVKSMSPRAVCLDCGAFVLESNAYVTRTDMSRMRGSIDESMAKGNDSVLLKDLREQEHRQESQVDQGLDQDEEGLYTDLGARSSDGRQVGLRHGTSARDGEEAWTLAFAERGRPSHERDTGRQPTGEPPADGQTASRHREEGVAQDDVPTLWRGDSGPQSCLACGGTLRLGQVLDPFVGSGTVLAVATGHGRDAIGIDLDARNFDLALGRVGPFMLTLGNIDEREL